MQCKICTKFAKDESVSLKPCTCLQKCLMFFFSFTRSFIRHVI